MLDRRPPEFIQSLWSELRTDVELERSLQRVFVRTTPVQGVWLLQMRRRVAADQLTAREREVAEAFSLGISSKAELDRMVSTD